MSKHDASPDELDYFQSSVDDEGVDSEDPSSGYLRRAQRYALRSTEVIAGLPGDIVQTVRGGLQSTVGLDPEEDLNFAQRGARSLLESFSGSAELRARSAESHPELEPQSQLEEIEDEEVEDFTSFMLPSPGGSKQKIGKKVFRALGISAFGNLSKQAIRGMGGGETSQEVGKLGAFIFGGMYGKGRGVKSHIKRLYKKAADFVPDGASFKYPDKRLDKTAKILAKGAMNDAKQEAQGFVEQIRDKTVNGMMSVEDATQFDQDINRAIGKAGNDKTKLFNLQQVKDAHTEALDAYGKTNQAWNDVYKEAKMAYAGIAQSEDMKKFLRKNANLKNLTYGAALLGMEEMKVPGHARLKIGALGAVAATYFAKEMGKRLLKNPALRKYYQNVLTASLTQNKPMLARNLAGLERASEKEFEEDPIPEDIMLLLEQQGEQEE